MYIINEIYPTTRNLKLGLYNNNLSDMSRKLNEEIFEVIEAVTQKELEPTTKHNLALAQELLDTIQMAFNMLNYLKLLDKIKIVEEVREHNEKLQERGWECDTSLTLEIKEVQHERQIQESSNL